MSTIIFISDSLLFIWLFLENRCIFLIFDDREISIWKCVCCCRSELIVKKFLDLDLETDDLDSFLRDFVMPTSEGKLWKCFLRTAVEKNHWFGNHSVVWWNWSQLGAMLNLSITLVHVQLRNYSTDNWRRFCLNYTFFIEKYIEQQSDWNLIIDNSNTCFYHFHHAFSFNKLLNVYDVHCYGFK